MERKAGGNGRALCGGERRAALNTAQKVKEAGATILRGGASKPRTSPYSFRAEEEGLKILHNVSKATGLKVITEVVDTRDVELVSQYADILQIGAKKHALSGCSMNVGPPGKPVLLKRGLACYNRRMAHGGGVYLKCRQQPVR